MKEQNNFQFHSVNIIQFIWTNRLPLIIVTSIAIVASVVASYMITPKFKAEVIVFPAEKGTLSQDLVAQYHGKESALSFGEEEEVEQLLQILNSDRLRDSIIAKFDLMKHYKLDPKMKHVQSILYYMYGENISCEPTRFLSIRIKVMDTDPQVAADIANAIAVMSDELFNAIQREKAVKSLEVVQYEYDNAFNSVTKLEDSIQYYRKMGVMSYTDQVERLTEAYGKALVENNKRAEQIIEQKLELIGKYGGIERHLTEIAILERRRLVDLNQKLMEAQMDAHHDVPQVFIVNKAEAADKKDYPVRWLIVAMGTISAFVLTLMLLVFRSAFKDVKLK